jgi:hypothetical protein
MEIRAVKSKAPAKCLHVVIADAPSGDMPVQML